MTIDQLNPRPKISQEFATVVLPEKRLKERLDKIVPILAAHPDKSFPDAFGNPSALAAFYRFVENERIEPDSLLETHTASTAARAAEVPNVYLISDSSFVIRTRPDAEEKFLNIDHSKSGFGLHTVLATTAQPHALPLGVTSMEVFEPAPFPKQTPRSKRREDPKRPMKRWLRGIDRTVEVLEAEGVSGIHLMDREADSYEIWAHLAKQEQDAIIRSRFNRKLAPDAEGRRQKLRDRIAERPVLMTLELELPARAPRPEAPPRTQHSYPARKARKAVVELRLARVTTVRPPRKPKDWPETIDLWAVELSEPDPPKGEKPIDWLLLANYPVETPHQALEVIQGYRKRWLIEDYHKVLKTGCSLEDRQFQSVETFEIALRLLAPIAWKLLLAARLHRQLPTTPASVAFDEYEVTALRLLCRRKRKKLPARLTVKRAFEAVAELGGWLKKPSRPPGWLVLTRGMQKVEDAAMLLREVGINRPPG